MNINLKSLLAICLLCTTLTVAAQQRAHVPTDLIRSMNWDIIASVNFRQTKENKIMPIYGEMIRRFEDQEFSLTGYIIPIKTGRKHQQFLLSPLPINQCYYCGQNGIPAMIMINMSGSINYSSKPVTINGILTLENIDATSASPVSLSNAYLVNP